MSSKINKSEIKRRLVRLETMRDNLKCRYTSEDNSKSNSLGLSYDLGFIEGRISCLEGILEDYLDVK